LKSSRRVIPFFNYPALFARDERELAPILEDVLRRGAFIMQKELLQFEENLANYLGIRHVVGVADGTVALMIGLRAAGIKTGDEVIVPSHTFVASAAAIHHVGAIPILADCGPDHLIDAEDVALKITSRTKAIMPVQLNGRTANMDGIEFLSKKHGLSIVEDSAQALGSKFKDRYAGTFGICGSCSFYPSKTLGCFGDGGAVLTNDDSAGDLIRVLRDHGRVASGDVVEWGYNSRLDNLQAAVLNFKLSRYGEEIKRRREIASIYNDKLKNLPGLVLPPAPDSDSDHFDIFQNYEVESNNREALREHLRLNGVMTIIQWGGKMLHQFRGLKLNEDVPNAEAVSKKFFLLPMNTSLSDEDVRYVCEQVESFYR
jgi:dTDP-4-amino-4,6-dideoxygalactose transaminase